ncbi:family 16 glycoside hydrolase [Aquimarina algicola]|uniref:3-keto-alpha-glucoside-1,2-lyase/3-keto-2-hydroxy-glucal hydratase domain-containing protein n=1 Tax=Aquimarina algicola TaxID=2589995 RepID=A0A504JHD4_9FLAO|nr:family 16 glycoside hydrolase [Aquimarina algicola]TPN87815.1 hypothetical protein FHK87_09585 [Aquimarina algicola]
MNSKKAILKLLTLFFTISTFGQGILFKKNQCIILDEENKPTTRVDTIYKGKSCVKIDGKNQTIVLTENLDIKNFRVDMDIAGEVMSGLGFRVANKNNYQFIYFRPGMGNTQEAIQYIPIYNGALSWVFYNYPKYETKADIKSLEWFHTTIEVKGNNLKVFVDNNPVPQMDVTLLETDVSGGNFILRSLFGTSYFANIKYATISEKNSGNSLTPDQKTFLTDWEISQQFQRDTLQGHLNTELKGTDFVWRNIKSKNDNYVNFSRYFEHPEGVVIAKKTLKSEENKNSVIHFDFVGKLKIILNGEEVFSSKKIKFERVFDDTFRINISLKKGNNELLMVSEGDAAFFGKGFKYLGRFQHTNWGFIARIDD